jgi:cellulose synthase/poly-beta-1,6-N-acetylglucosamine synthase-like glycosyltransferase
LLDLSGFAAIRESKEILFPIGILFLAPFLNRFLVRIWPFNHLALTNFIVTRLQPSSKPLVSQPQVSIVVPARNEAGNIENILCRVLELGAGTEIIFVEGHSRDNTFAAITDGIAKHPERRCLFIRQTGKGKGDAVRLGFAQAGGDLLMILDADLTVPS